MIVLPLLSRIESIILIPSYPINFEFEVIFNVVFFKSHIQFLIEIISADKFN